LEVPELKMLGKTLEEDALAWDFKNNTLIVQYRKPVVGAVVHHVDSP
jgi:hypothetical protein